MFLLPASSGIQPTVSIDPHSDSVVLPAPLAAKAKPVKVPTVYILANRPRGVLYVGVTSNLIRRVWQHKTKQDPGFTRRYNVTNLVWYELHSEMRSAIQREKAIKKWRRTWKLILVEEMNPMWRDCWDEITNGFPLSRE